MRFGVIRNIAGNIEAFGNADLLLDHSGVDVKVCLGQIVGIYPFVDDCVEFLINRRYLALRRDEEDEFVGDCRFTGLSTTHLVDALRFARSRVAASSLKFLAELPVRHVIQGVAFESRAEVRGGVLNDPDQVADAFLVWRDRTVFHAAHFDPYVWREDLTGASLSTGPNIL